MLFKVLALLVSIAALLLALDEWMYMRALQKKNREEEDEEWNVSWFH